MGVNDQPPLKCRSGPSVSTMSMLSPGMLVLRVVNAMRTPARSKPTVAWTDSGVSLCTVVAGHQGRNSG